MRKIVLNLAVSLDGYISRINGSVDWLDNLDTGGNDLGFSGFLEECDTILMGRKSYDETLKLGNGEWPFKNLKTIVFTRQEIDNKAKIYFSSKNPQTVIDNLLSEKGKNIWLFGGGTFIKSMREYNLIDEYIITTIPIFIGNGIRLFQDINMENKLELISSSKYNDIIQSHYKVIK